MTVCVICGNEFKPRQASRKQQTCGLLCRQKLIARRPRPGLVGQRSKKPAERPLRIRCRIHLDDPRCGSDRRGYITRRVIDHGRPLLTVRLDYGGWPGGTEGHHDANSWSGWYVELREDEVELL